LETKAITEVADATLTGTMPFPEVVAKLIAAGVEYYHVDYVGLCSSFMTGLADGSSRRFPTKRFRPSRLSSMPRPCAAILDSQQKGLKYRDFTEHAMAAGVQSYYAFLRGQRVIYLGRTGDQHTEWFPGAKPRQ
jgi:uncharacterized protein YbcV (DUF1398 family)